MVSAILENGMGGGHYVVFSRLFSPYPADSYGRYKLGLPAGRIQTEDEQQKYVKEKLDTMLEIVNTMGCEKLILSGEYCLNLHLDVACHSIKKFLNEYFLNKGVKVIVVCFVRNPLTWLISYLQQYLSNGLCSEKVQKEEQFNWINNTRRMLREAFINLKKYFADSLILIKFEDAVNDKDGLVGCFLKAIGFPREKIADMRISKVNESRCMEVIEIINYIAGREPVLLLGENETYNTNRYPGDLCVFDGIRGVKFDLPFQDKVELWGSLQETVRLFKSDAGIDYTDYQISLPTEQETYSEKTIQGFIEAFPKLNPVLQKLFLEFFEMKYTETAHDKFRRLYDEGSIPWRIFSLYEEAKMLWECNNRKDGEISRLYSDIDKLKETILNSRSWRITKPLRKMSMCLRRILRR